MNDRIINQYLAMLEPDGWESRRASASASGWTLAEYVGKARTMRVYLGIIQDMVTWQLPFGFIPLPECRGALAMYLMRVNYHLRVVRFALDERYRVHLLAEMPRSDCDYASFRRVMLSLALNFDANYHEVLAISKNPELAQGYLTDYLGKLS